MPAELRAVFENMTDQLTEELLQAWKSGLCDGMEWSARAVEAVLAKLAENSREQEILMGVALGIRQAEMSVLLDDPTKTETEDAC